MDRPPLLFRVLHAEKARSTHHKLALDALTHLRGDDAAAWRNLLLRHVEPFLAGAKAPDKVFKDFRNHVLHVGDGLWGGAPGKAREWYGTLVEKLAARDWPAAAHAAGVLSHYYSDPLMPFHTAQSEREKVIHRAAEWSCAKSYDRFKELLETSLGWPDVAVPAGDDWLEKMTIAGAVRSNQFYDGLADRYDFAAGVRNPPAGLDDVCRRELALCVGHAAVGFARIFEKAADESGAVPAKYGVSVVGFLTAFTRPILWLTRKLADAGDRREVLRIWNELQATGDVVENLPEDDRVVRELHRKEVLGETPEPTEAPAPAPEPVRVRPAPASESAPAPASKPVPAPAPAAKAPPPRPAPAPAVDRGGGKLTFRLHPADPVVDAPGIGPKTAARLQKAGVNTVAELLSADPHDLAAELDTGWIVPETARDWQDQARLMCRVPNVYGHDAQILTEVGVIDPADLARRKPADLLALLGPALATREGERILRGGTPPDLAEVTDWVAWAADARDLPAVAAAKPRRTALAA